MALAAQQAQQAQQTVRLQHQYNATPEQVFAAWSNPEALGNGLARTPTNAKSKNMILRKTADTRSA